ncbi:MAG: Flp family type IVb pilin [Gemmataceae bacterium]
MQRVIAAIVDFFEREEGPTAVEYAVMMGLIIAVCVGAVDYLGSRTSAAFSTVETAFGSTESQNTSTASAAAITSLPHVQLPSGWNGGDPQGGVWKNDSKGQIIASRPNGGEAFDSAGGASPWVRVRASNGDQFTWYANGN